MFKRSILDKIFTGKRLSRVTAQDEQLILWSTFGNEEVRTALIDPALAQDIEKRNGLLKKSNDDLFKNIDPDLWLLFEDNVQTSIRASEQFIRYQQLHFNLGEDKYKSQVWSCSSLLTIIITGDAKKIIYSDLSPLNIIYVLLFGLEASNRTLEYLFNLLDFTVYFATNTKLTKIADLLWFRLSLLFWQLGINDDPLTKQLLLEKYKIADCFKERFFKIISFYCFNNVQDKSSSSHVRQAQKLNDFISGLPVGGILEIKIFMFIQKILKLDLLKAHKLLGGLSSSMVVYFYEQYHKQLITEIRVCPLLLMISKIISVGTTKVLAGELEISSVNSMITNCRKRLLEETTALQETQSTLRTLQLAHKSDHECLSKQVSELKQSVDLLQECREQQTKNLDDRLKELEKIDSVDIDLKTLDDIKLKCYGIFTALMSFRALKTSNYLNYYCRYLFLVFRLVDYVLALWIETLRRKVDSPAIFTRILVVKRIKQCELSFHTLQAQKGSGEEFMLFSSYLIEDLVIRMNCIVALLNTQDVRPTDDEAVLVNFIKVIGGQFNNQIELGATAKVRNIKAI